jgi:hypothetical protein
MLRRGLLALALSAGLVGVSARGQTPLAWKFNKDDAFRYQTVSTSKQVMKLLDKKGKPEGKEIVQEIEYDMTASYKVLDATPDGGAVLEMKVESMQFKNAAAFASPILTDKEVQGATLKITLNAKREVTNIDGFEAYLKKLAVGDSNALKRLQTLVSKELLTESARNAFGFLPSKPAKSWTRDIVIPLGALGDLAITNTYKDEGSDQLEGKAVQKIVFDSAVKYSPPSAKGPSGDVRVEKGELKRTDKNKGTIYFDAAAGRMVATNYQITLTGTMSLVCQGTPIDAEISQDQKTKTTLLK